MELQFLRLSQRLLRRRGGQQGDCQIVIQLSNRYLLISVAIDQSENFDLAKIESLGYSDNSNRIDLSLHHFHLFASVQLCDLVTALQYLSRARGSTFTMSFSALAGGAECGPVNPLSQLSKTFAHDRGAQQVCQDCLCPILSPRR